MARPAQLLRLRVGCRLAVLWEFPPEEAKEPSLFTAEIKSVVKKQWNLEYADGEKETLSNETLATVPHVRLPNKWPVTCGSRALCRERGKIELTTTLDHNSNCAVCHKCTKVFHMNCATELEMKYADEQKRRPRRLKTRTAVAATKWLCPKCFKLSGEACNSVRANAAPAPAPARSSRKSSQVEVKEEDGLVLKGEIAPPSDRALPHTSGKRPLAPSRRTSGSPVRKRLRTTQSIVEPVPDPLSLARAVIAQDKTRTSVYAHKAGKKMGSKSGSNADPSLCALCLRRGSIPECEGKLLGPFTVGSRELYAHRNCLAWAPESFEYRSKKGLELNNAEKVFPRARGQKCVVCRKPGASLSCMYMRTKCCKGMHFRCALLVGASLMVDFHGAYITFCVTHKEGPYKVDHEKVPQEHLRVQTPLDPSVFSHGRLCHFCKKDNFVYDSTLLECATCGKLMHSNCALPSLFAQENGLICVDGAFAVLSKERDFHCSDCVRCYNCHKPMQLVKDRSRSTDAPVDMLRNGEKVEQCISCKHSMTHLSCQGLQESYVREDMDGGSPSSDLAILSAGIFRCEMCRGCKHCGTLRVSISDWDEELTACRDCARRHGEGHMCPVCTKAYREDEPNMIQCDDCDKWVHGFCCDFNEEEYQAVGESDEAFFCAVCKRKEEQAAKKAQKKRRTKANIAKANIAKADTDLLKPRGDEEIIEDEGVLVASGDTETLVEVEDEVDPRDWDEEARHDVALYFNSARARGDRHSRQFGGGLVPQIDLCRSCGSGGEDVYLRYCADCGEGIHGFCLKGKLPPRDERCNVSNSRAGTVQRFTAGGLGEKAPPWRCERCAICKECGKTAATHLEVTSEVQEVITCEHCFQVFHGRCFSRPFVAAGLGVTGHEKLTLCTSCQVCELCLLFTPSLQSLHGRLFCDGCADTVRMSKPCSICCSAYPNLPPYLSKSLHDSSVSVVPAKKCETCFSLVHIDCDSGVKSDNAFICRICVERAGCGLCMTGLHPIGSCQRSIGEKVKHYGTKDQSAIILVNPGSKSCRHSIAGVEDSENGHMVSISNTTSPGGEEPMEPVSEDNAKEAKVNPACNGRFGNYATADPSLVDDVSCYLGVEERICELCFGAEKAGSYLGRLLPWKKNLGTRVVWAHSMCALWCHGMKRIFTKTEAGPSVTCYLVAAGKNVAGKNVYDILRTKACEGCGKEGASVKCAEEGCNIFFHLPCAVESGCRLNTRVEGIDCDSSQQIELFNVQHLALYCKEHSGDGSELSSIADDCFAGCVPLSVCCRLNLLTPIRLLDSSENSRRCSENGNVMLRAGALTVFNSGALVPNSSLFLENGALVATEYRAARRYWSLRHPGQRCSLLLEVSGTARTGPRFSLRFSDDPGTVICASSASAVWEKLSAALEMSRLKSDEVSFSEASLVDCGATFAFGLARCEASVSLLESLPHSFLFKGRYTFKWRSPEPPKDLPFREPKLAYVVEPPAATSARLAGFLPRRILTDRKLLSTNGISNIPSYENIPTGARFQVHVAMGLGKAVFEDQGGESIFGAKQTSSNGRASKSRVSGVGEDTPRGRTGIANLPHTMQHRIMLKTWRRRTVVLRSGIEGWGVYAIEDIPEGEMVIEYMGEIIRTLTSDFREEYYDSKGIGCYMFEVSPGVIADATKNGNRARYINHSCDPNCFSRTVAVENNRRVIVIFAKRDIKRGEELCYDYQFPLDDEDRVKCACGSTKCVGYMN